MFKVYLFDDLSEGTMLSLLFQSLAQGLHKVCSQQYMRIHEKKQGVGGNDEFGIEPNEFEDTCGIFK